MGAYEFVLSVVYLLEEFGERISAVLSVGEVFGLKVVVSVFGLVEIREGKSLG